MPYLKTYRTYYNKWKRRTSERASWSPGSSIIISFLFIYLYLGIERLGMLLIMISSFALALSLPVFIWIARPFRKFWKWTKDPFQACSKDNLLGFLHSFYRPILHFKLTSKYLVLCLVLLTNLYQPRYSKSETTVKGRKGIIVLV